ncbi:MAG: anti-sigma factor [Betaproteobacteria bacterium]|nr:anti-sigma factor [Betaproteobacteria bacterium]
MENREDSELAGLIKKNADYFEAPHDLRNRINQILAQAPAQQEPGRAGRWPAWRQWWGMGAAFAVGVMLSVAVVSWRAQQAAQDDMVEQVVDSHIRSLMGTHLSDIASSDQHTVKPWLSHHLDFSPPVADLAAAGFPLTGGRMDYMEGHPVAALVYQRHLHTINVFVWPLHGKSQGAPVSAMLRGFNVQSWEKDGMQFWAVSDVQADELVKFESLLREQSGL